MSQITRRDFMKTAGVMTLAVAASGVLAGCSTADDSTKPTTTGTLSVGESVTVENVSFTVTGAKLLQKVTKTANDDTKTYDDVISDRELYILVTMNSTKESTAKDFDASKLTVYVNGKSVTKKGGFTADKKEDLGDEDIAAMTTGTISVPYTKNGTAYVIAITGNDIPSVTYGAGASAETEYKTINSIDLIYKDANKLDNTFAYSIDVPTAATYAD